ncbi:MAG: DUF1232 domain-containing protein [Anaerovoracaceae bacterium]|nr:DUF1232 domain-containing protein [Bacillota bacterium]MDY5975698.1 DUF1232 domain-containing protein [Anaerovoracaceae bacterium]
MRFIAFRVLAKRIRALFYMLKDRRVKWYKKILILFGLIYLVSPVDLVPPVVPVLGFLDDIVLWSMIIYYLKDELDNYWLGEKSVDYSSKFRDTVNPVNYTVSEDDEDEEKVNEQ